VPKNVHKELLDTRKFLSLLQKTHRTKEIRAHAGAFQKKNRFCGT